MHACRTITVAIAFFSLICFPTAGGSLHADQKQTADPLENEVPLHEQSVEQVGTRISELIKSINRILATGSRYRASLAAASEENRYVLQLQLWALNQRGLKQIHQLADGLLRLEQNSPQPELRRDVVNIFAFALEHIQFHSEHLREDIDKIRAQRPEVAVNERYGLEMSIAHLTQQLDGNLQMYLAHIHKMKQVDLNIKAAQDDLTELLYMRSEELSGRIALAVSRIDALESQTKEIPDDADAAKLLVCSKNNLNNNTSSLNNTLDIMDQVGLNTQARRSELVTTTRDFASGLMDTEVAVSLASRALTNFSAWLVEKGPRYLLKILIVLAIVYIFRIISRLVRKGLDRAIEASHLNLSQLARRMIVGLAANLVMILGLMMALSQLGISMGPLLAGLGVAGFIVGFALQDTLGNFASGMMILLYRPFDVGDLVEIGGVTGEVDKMTLVSTGLLTTDNQSIVIPNNKIWGDVIKNVTAQSLRRIDMVFGISYDDDIPKAEQVLEGILESHPKVLKSPRPVVRLHTLGASSVDFVVRPWVRVSDYWDVYWDLTRTVKLRFDEESISFPFPQQDVHLYSTTQPEGGSG